MGRVGKVDNGFVGIVEAGLEGCNAAANCTVVANHAVQECGDELEGASLMRLILQEEGNLGVEGKRGDNGLGEGGVQSCRVAQGFCDAFAIAKAGGVLEEGLDEFNVRHRKRGLE